MLFLTHLASKMRTARDGGGRAEPYPNYRECKDRSLGHLPAHRPEPPHLTHVASASITNGLGEAAADGEATWPRYIRTTGIKTLFTLNAKKRVTLPPAIAAGAML